MKPTIILNRDGTFNRILERTIINTSTTSSGYLTFSLNGKMTFLHRFVWEMHNGEIPEDMVVDHINHIRNDNRLSNLRLATLSQNSSNCKDSVRQLERELPRGVFIAYKSKRMHWDKGLKTYVPDIIRYQARVMVNGKTILSEKVDSLKEANRLARELRTKYHGEFACHGGIE